MDKLNGGKAMDTVRSETVRQFDGSYYGRIAVYDTGRRLYALKCDVNRISRGEALRDANQLAHDVLIENGRTL